VVLVVVRQDGPADPRLPGEVPDRPRQRREPRVHERVADRVAPDGRISLPRKRRDIRNVRIPWKLPVSNVAVTGKGKRDQSGSSQW